MGLLLLTINYVKCFKCLFILPCLPRETLLKCFLYKRRGRIEDALLEIMAMNVFLALLQNCRLVYGRE